MSDNNIGPDGTQRMDTFDTFANDVFGTTVEANDVETPSEEDTAEVEELEVDVNSEEEAEVEEDGESLSDEADDESEEESDEVEEPEESIPTARTLKINGEEVEVNADDAFDFYQRHEGKLQAVEAKQQEAATALKEAEAKLATANYLQFQGELQKEFFELQDEYAMIEQASQAWEAGQAFQGYEGRDLKDEIDKVSRGYTKRLEALQEKSRQAPVDSPGRVELESESGLTNENAKDKFASWTNTAIEHGFTQEEMLGQRDFRVFRLLNKIEQLEAEKAEKTKRQTKTKAAAKSKVPTGSTSGKSASGPKGQQKSSFTKIAEEANTGSRRGKHAAMDDIFG